MLSCRLVRDEALSLIELWCLCLVAVYAIFHFVAEVADKSLDGPGGSITERADGMSFDLYGEFLEHVDFGKVSVADLNALKEIEHPTGSFTTRCTLPARLVAVEVSQS